MYLYKIIRAVTLEEAEHNTFHLIFKFLTSAT